MVMGQSERSNVIKMENCTVFWMKVDGWIRSEAVNINTKAVYFHAVTLSTFNFEPVSKKNDQPTGRQRIPDWLYFVLITVSSSRLGVVFESTIEVDFIFRSSFRNTQNEAQTN